MNSTAPSFGSFGRYFVASNMTRSGLPSSRASQSVETRGSICFPISAGRILEVVVDLGKAVELLA